MSGAEGAGGRHQHSDIVHNGAVVPGMEVPTPEELFEMYERGEFDPDSKVEAEEPIEGMKSSAGKRRRYLDAGQGSSRPRRRQAGHMGRPPWYP